MATAPPLEQVSAATVTPTGALQPAQALAAARTHTEAPPLTAQGKLNLPLLSCHPLTRFPPTNTFSHSYGNKSSDGYGDSSKEDKKDSTMGKLMEKAGDMLGKDNIAEKGRAKREEAARADNTY